MLQDRANIGGSRSVSLFLNSFQDARPATGFFSIPIHPFFFFFEMLVYCARAVMHMLHINQFILLEQSLCYTLRLYMALGDGATRA
jgi:hypothetical protein